MPHYTTMATLANLSSFNVSLFSLEPTGCPVVFREFVKFQPTWLKPKPHQSIVATVVHHAVDVDSANETLPSQKIVYVKERHKK